MPMRLMPAPPPPASHPSVPAKAPTTLPSSAASDAFAAQAAARHARRVACLKEARDKKLVGAGKNSYVKDCVGAP
jgi:hypothetical protein